MLSGAHRTMASDVDFRARLAEMERDGRVSGVHTLLVSRGGRLLFEHYGTGDDESWGKPLGTVTLGPTVLHDLRSVTKSIVGMLYGIALADGKVPAPETKLYDQFREYADLGRQSGRERITIAHVLGMTLGTEWDELTIPYGDPRNSENAMELSPDRYRFVLDRPIVGEPSRKWTYNGGAAALLGRLITKGTGAVLRRHRRRHPGPYRAADRRHRLGRPAPVPDACARSHRGHECRQLSQAWPVAAAYGNLTKGPRPIERRRLPRLRRSTREQCSPAPTK
jgi:CubicO group peptidase (beta-lactamase class C family)